MTFKPASLCRSLEILSQHPMRMIAVDIGNTSCKFGLFDSPRLDDSAKAGVPITYPFSMVDIRLLPKQLKALPIWVSTFAHDTNTAAEPFCWFIASVNHPHTESLLELLQTRRQSNDILCFLNTNDIPIETKYSDPSCLGIDRKLAALAASRRFSPPTPVLLADIGTAAKIDLIDETGVFLGGVILPGPQTALNSLSEKTDALPQLQWKANHSAWNYPAEDTSNAILLGTSGGLLGAILYFYASSLDRTGKRSIPIILTGGGAPGLEPRLFSLLTRFFPEETNGPLWIRTVRDLILTGIELTREIANTPNCH